jgi:uncharacterized protein YjbI with pentapeptide repeats
MRTGGERIMNQKASPPSPSAPPVSKARWLFAALAISLCVNAWFGWKTVVGPKETPADLYWIVCQADAPKVERLRAFLALIESGHTRWPGAELKQLDLRGLDFSGKNLDEADLTGSNMEGVNLTGASLNATDLPLADLTGADLSGGKGHGVQLFRSALDGAKLSRADFAGAHMQEVGARNADFSEANLADAELIMARLSGSDFSGADLTGADLEAAVLKSANLNQTRLNGANLKDADFTDSNWWRARGLTSQQVGALQKYFAPRPNADEALRRDYAEWRREIQN